MIRQVIQIDEGKCNGCGICAEACHEGAIGIVDGKARLLRDDFCDGMGDCLPSCPQNAISFVEREAAAYDEAAVAEAAAKRKAAAHAHHGGGCPGSAQRSFERAQDDAATASKQPSALSNWPVQIKLAPPAAPYFQGTNLLIAADCCAYSYGSFHADYIAGRTLLVGCPKLDAVDYAEKLAQIFANNDIASITLTRMEVPCCGGLEMACVRALEACGKPIPLRVVTFSLEGEVIDERKLA